MYVLQWIISPAGPPVRRKVSLCLAALLFCLGAGIECRAEAPPVLQATGVLPPGLFSGPHHKVAHSVRNDGMQNLYQLQTLYGTFPVRGTDQLRLRIRELESLARMKETRALRIYLKAAASDAIAPARGTVYFVRKPRTSVRNGVQEVKKRAQIVVSSTHRLFGSEKRLKGHRPDGVVSRMSGYSAAKRKIAAQYGVDPYTRFEPLSARLALLARADTAGKLTTKAGYSFVTGGATTTVRTAISVGEKIDKLRPVLRKKSVKDLNKLNAAALTEMFVKRKTVKAFLKSEVLSRTDKTIIVNALKSLDGVTACGIYVAHAARTQNEVLAFSVRRQAELIASYSERVRPVRAFIQLGSMPAAKVDGGQLVVILSADHLAWTPETAEMMTAR